jgi:hypothetical protein
MGLFQKPLTGSFSLFYILILGFFFKYETIFRSSTSSFGHSDPDPSSVSSTYRLEMQWYIVFILVHDAFFVT